MQKIFTNIKFNSRAIISIMVIICLFALGFALTATLPQVSDNGDTIVASAATTITSDNYRSVIQLNGSSGTVTGEYKLDSDITISINNDTVNIATFSGTFDGNGHKITVSGSDSYRIGANNDYYVGAVFGRLGASAVVKNLTIEWNAYWTMLAGNSKSSSNTYSGEGSTTIYVGGLCGLAYSGAKIENLTFNLNSTIAGVGIDDSADHENCSGGQGAVVGAMIGRSQGAKLRNITFNNNGSVWARGQNVSAGASKKGATVMLSTPNTRADRAVAGGMIGETQSGSTEVYGLVFKGDGYVGAAATGRNNYVDASSAQYLHTINLAGGLLGYNYGGTLTIHGLLYEYQGRCYVKELAGSAMNAGTIVGVGNGTTINGLWRSTADASKNSGVGIYNYYSSTSGPSKTGASSLTIKNSIGNGSISSVYKGTEGSLTVNTLREYTPKAYYAEAESADGSVTFGSGIVKNIKFSDYTANNGALVVEAKSDDQNYLISALTYNMVNNGAFSTKNYYNVAQTTHVTFDESYQIPINCNEFRVILATTEKSLYVVCDGNKIYDTTGIFFQGAPSATSNNLLSNLYWVAEHDTDSTNNIIGDMGSAQITTGANVGTYSMVLYRYDSKTGQSTKVQDGESLGVNNANAPSKIYLFDATKAQNYKYTISRAEVDLVQLSASYTREYDGTSNVDGNDLTYRLHYGFYLAGTNNAPLDTPTFTIGAGNFYDSTGALLDGSVGSNKVVKISGLNVTGNYVLSANSGTSLTLYNCKITERTLDCEWSNLHQTYNGNKLEPSVTATNLIGGDNVVFNYAVYNTINDAISGTEVTKTTVKDGSKGDDDYYVVRATIASNPNYKLRDGYIQEHMYVYKKEIGLTWTAFNKGFSNENQEVTCVVTNANTVIAAGDEVGIVISYYHNETATNNVPLKNAGTYVATATITNENYSLNSATATFSDIRITPIDISVVFYTGTDSSSNDVYDLVYQGTTYNKDANGLHAKLAPASQGKGLIDDNIDITYSGDMIIVGTYTATASLVESYENPDDSIVLTNYSISNAQQSVTIVPRAIMLTYDTDSYEYDGSSHTVVGYVGETLCGNDIVTVIDQVYDSNYNPTTAIDAGSYTVRYSLRNPNYTIKTGYDSHVLTITQYDMEKANSVVSIDKIADIEYIGYEINQSTINPNNPNEKLLNIVVRFGETIMQAENYTVYISNNTNAGTANVTISGQKNFKGSIETTFTITKALLNVRFTSPTTLPYNGKTQAVTAEFIGYKAQDGEIGMTIDYGGKTPKDYGRYTATVNFTSAPANYVLSDNIKDRQFNFEITQKTLEIGFSGYSNLTYDGTNHKYDALTNPDGIKVAFKNPEYICEGDTLELNITFIFDATKREEEPRNAGVYTATATLSGNSNYAISSNSINPVKFEIAKYLIALEYDLSTVSHVYSAEAKTASYSISASTPIIAEDPVISLSYRNMDTDSDIIGNPVNVGNYQISARVGNANYTTDTKQVQNFVIAKAPLEIRFNLQNGGIYNYEANKRTISYTFVAPNTTLGSDEINLVVKYYDESGASINDCINAGTYKVSAELPTNVEVAKNYYIINANDNYSTAFSDSFTIMPRYIFAKFDKNSNANTYYYDGTTMVVGAEIGDNYGRIEDAGYYDKSGVMLDLNLSAEKVSFIVKLYKGSIISDEYEIESIKDVGTYTATVTLDANNPINKNYLIYEDNQERYPTTATIVINPKDITFKTSSVKFKKTYGDEDGSLILALNTQNTTGILEGDEIYVKLLRQSGENVGDYRYTGFNLVNKVVDENNNVSYEIVNSSEANSNYNINYFGYDGANDTFRIDELEVYFDAKRFEFDYMTPIINLVQEIRLYSPVLGEYTVIVAMEPINSNTIKEGTDAGSYDLSTSCTDNNSNVVCKMNEGTNKGKIVIVGRSVKVTLNNNHIYAFDNNTYYITFGETFTYKDAQGNDITSYDPDYYNGLLIDFEKCDANITEENFKQYVRITREAITSSYDIGGIPYKESGYALTIEFLKKLDNGEFIVDKNYRAIDENGNNVNYRLFVNKFNLNTVFNVGNDATRPSVTIQKPYDGTKTASIDPSKTNIPERFLNHQLSVYAEYDNANAGQNKIINIIYKFKVDEYANNYVLPGEIGENGVQKTDGILKYTDQAIIDKVNLTLTFGQGDYDLVYGEHYSQNVVDEFDIAYPNIIYKGFVNNETPDSANVGIKVYINYKENYLSGEGNVETIMSASKHTIVIINDKESYTNYNIVKKNERGDLVVVQMGEIAAEQDVNITPREVTISAGSTFVKTVDGTTYAEITQENYVINGLIERDANTTGALKVNYKAVLTSADPGKTTVVMTINALEGTHSDNYKLPANEDSRIVIIPAEIKELAIVKFGNKSYSFDFDNTAKTVEPIIEEDSIQENVKYILKYEGRRYDGKDYLLQTSAPKSAGVYTINCYFYHESDEQDISKYRLLASTEMVINKVTPTLYFTGTFTQTYGSFTAINASVKAPGLEKAIDVRYSFENEDGTLPAFPPAGRHTVSASFEETNDYLDVEGTQSIQIKTKTISVSFDGYKNLVYNGYTRNDDVKVYFNGVIAGDTCEPVKIFNVDTIRDAGTYRLIVTPSNSSYTISGSNSVEFTIAKKVLKVSPPANITTYAGIAPKINLIYEGFVENEGVEDIAVLPTPKLTSGKVGVNVIEFNEGYDENYSFNYFNGVYTIVYESPNEDKPNITPYVVAGSAVGGIGLIFLIGYLVKIANYKAITRGVAKRTIRKQMMGKKK